MKKLLLLAALAVTLGMAPAYGQTCNADHDTVQEARVKITEQAPGSVLVEYTGEKRDKIAAVIEEMIGDSLLENDTLWFLIYENGLNFRIALVKNGCVVAVGQATSPIGIYNRIIEQALGRPA